MTRDDLIIEYIKKHRQVTDTDLIIALQYEDEFELREAIDRLYAARRIVKLIDVKRGVVMRRIYTLPSPPGSLTISDNEVDQAQLISTLNRDTVKLQKALMKLWETATPEDKVTIEQVLAETGVNKIQ